MPSPKQAELLATPCLPCRENHLKCDRLIPACGRCVQSGHECRLVFKFKSSKGSFRKNQRWLKAPRRLTYIDETRHVASGGSVDVTPIPDPGVEDSFDDEEDAKSEHTETGLHGDAADHGDSIALRTGEQHGRYSPSNRIIFHRTEPAIAEGFVVDTQNPLSSVSPFSQVHSPHSVNSQHAAPSSSGSRTTLESSAVLPLRTPAEAFLFRHYIQNLATCLDLCDPLRHFELVVPQRAGTSRTLLNAIFALAARHLSQTSQYDPLASNRYHDECLQYLIPMLNHASTVSDENLFAATIILRMLEEMDVPTMGQDNYSHLLGIHAFVNAGDRYMIPGSLSAASYWVGLRQEIYCAIITQAPVKINLEHFIVDRSLDSTDDYTWSNRAIVNLADVLNFCFADVASSTAQWSSLNDHCNKWAKSRPSSFDPFFYVDRVAPSAFPEVWHNSSCHIIGIQHNLLAQLFLIQFDPTIPRVGTKRGPAIRRMTQRIEFLMRQLCGIGMSNQWTPPALFTASMGIAMFGDRFEDQADQEAMIDVLKKTEENHARPTGTIQQQLKRVWGWVSDCEDDA